MELPLGVNVAVPVGEDDPTFGWGTSWVASSLTSVAMPMPPIPPDMEPVEPVVLDAEVLELPDAEVSEDLLDVAQEAIASEIATQTYRCIASPVWSGPPRERPGTGFGAQPRPGRTGTQSRGRTARSCGPL